MLDVAVTDRSHHPRDLSQRQELLHRLVNGPFVDPAAYAVVGLDGGRSLLVPRRQRAVQRAALLDYPGLQSAKEKVARRALFAALSAPAAPWLPAPDTGPDSTEGGGLWRLVAEAVPGTELVWCSAVLRPAGPHWTPIVHLFDGESRRVGVAKFGLNPATVRNLNAEADALDALGGHHANVIVPRLLGRASESRSAFVFVMEPLPSDVAGSPADGPVGDAVVEAIVDAGGSSPTTGRSEYLDDLRRFVSSLALDPQLAASCADLLGRPVRLARNHGDLVPWNVGTSAGLPVLWDFEYSRPDAPLGFDAVQGRYRLARERGIGIRPALIEAASGADAVLARLGLDAGERRVVGAVHALDAARRIHDGVDIPGTSPGDHVAAVRLAIEIGEGRPID